MFHVRLKCAQAGMERDRSGVVENTVPFDISEISESQTGIFGRMERTQGLLVVYCLPISENIIYKIFRTFHFGRLILRHFFSF